jgi:hypothetical protein
MHANNRRAISDASRPIQKRYETTNAPAKFRRPTRALPSAAFCCTVIISSVWLRDETAFISVALTDKRERAVAPGGST